MLFQKTADGRVANFLRGQGFAVDEVADGQTHAVSPGETIRIGRSGFYDSWNLFRADGRSVLNLNDCDLSSERDLLGLKAEIGPVDVLLTQFSYAAWKGGKANKALRQAAARDKLATVRRQIACLKPAALSRLRPSSTFPTSRTSISTTASTISRSSSMRWPQATASQSS